MPHKINPLPDREELNRILDYNPGTGSLRWRKGKFEGAVAGSVNSNGYLVVIVTTDSKPVQYRAHRIIWKMMTGDDPPEFVDHKDRDRLNNRWSNLRSATCAQNNRNSGIRNDNGSGIKGVHWDANRKKWAAFIAVGGKTRGIGRFSSVEQAASALNGARKKLHGEFARP